MGLDRGPAPPGRSSLALALGASLGLALLLPAAASAHELGLSQGIYRVIEDEGPTDEGPTVSVLLTLARAELRLLAHEVDQDRDGEVSEAEVMLGAGAIEEAIVGGLRIAVDARPCAARFDGATLSEEDGLEIALRFRCPGPDNAEGPSPGSAKAAPGESAGADPREPDPSKNQLEIDFSALVALGGRHRHIARVIPPGADEVRAERVLHRLRSQAVVPLGPQPPPAGEVASAGAKGAPPQRAQANPRTPGNKTAEAEPSATPLAERRRAQRISPPAQAAPIDRELSAYFVLGVEHILTGVDHLVFLLGLMIAGGRVRAWALMITAFTVGHSLSLTLATLAIWTPPSTIIEPLIAASVAYIGLENLLRSDTATAAGRWRLTLPFGVVHGFGFAGALLEVGVQAGDGALAGILALFNVGVEVGQLAALALMLLLLRTLPWLQGPSAKRWISAAIALAGLGWLVARLL